MKQDEHKRKNYTLPREACSRLDVLKQLLEAQQETLFKASCEASKEMIKIKSEHEQQSLYSSNH